jgi:hypothetical protein
MPYKNKTPEQIRKNIEESPSHERAAEIVPASEAALVPARSGAKLTAMIENLVRQRVDEVLSASGVRRLEVDLRPAQAAKVARQKQEMFERVKWVLYFEKWGCRVCERKHLTHASSGHCIRCHSRTVKRLEVIKHAWENSHPEAEIQLQIAHLTSRADTAQALLGGESAEEFPKKRDRKTKRTQ